MKLTTEELLRGPNGWRSLVSAIRELAGQFDRDEIEARVTINPDTLDTIVNQLARRAGTASRHQ